MTIQTNAVLKINDVLHQRVVSCQMSHLVILNHVFHVSQDLLQIRSYVYAEEPNIDIHNFIGTFTRVSAAITVPQLGLVLKHWMSVFIPAITG